MKPLERTLDSINAALPTDWSYRLLSGDRVQLFNGQWPIEEPRSLESLQDAYRHLLQKAPTQPTFELL